MGKRVRGYLSEEQVKFLRLLLDQADPSIRETALERLCELYRDGLILRAPFPFRQICIGLLHDRSPKVVRWALNAIAVLGRRSENLLPVLDAINRYKADQDIVGSGVAALVHLVASEEVAGLLKKIDVPFEGVALLAAAQQTDKFLVELSKHPIRPDRADSSLLRLATVLVGLDKAPENLFEPKYENAEIVGVLNQHHDALVAQYSIWAITENSRLGLEHLSINLQDIGGLPPNIRGWIYQLIGGTASFAKDKREYLRLGSEDAAEKARLGLATGLRATYFDGLEEVSLDWLAEERSSQVRMAILEHMARHALRSPSYDQVVKSEFIQSPADSLLRLRIEAAAAGTSLYRDLKKIGLREGATLFSDEMLFGGGSVTQNIQGHTINIANMSGRDTVNSGNVDIKQSVIIEAQAVLDRLSSLLGDAKEKDIRDGRELVEQAKREPSKSNVERVLGWMKAIKEGANYAVAATGAFGEIFESIQKLADKL